MQHPARDAAAPDGSSSGPSPALAQRYVGSGKLRDKVAIVTAADAGIGRSTAVCFAKEGADVVVAYQGDPGEARLTRDAVAEVGARCVLMRGDLASPGFPDEVVDRALDTFGRIDVLVNNLEVPPAAAHLDELRHDELQRRFIDSFFALFDLCRAALPHLGEGAAIINTAPGPQRHATADAVRADAASQDAVIAFTRALARQLAARRIRVNAVALGPVDAPQAGAELPAATPPPVEPDRIAPSFVFLASADAGRMTGEVLHPNGFEG